MAGIGRRLRPGRRRWPFWAGSVAIHLLIVAVWRLNIAASFTIPAATPTLNLALLEPFPAPGKALRQFPQRPPRGPAAVQPAPQLVSEPTSAAADAPRAASREDSSALVPPAPAQFHHEMGDSRLWVRPLPPEQLSAIHRLTRTTADLADSVSRAVVQAYLDSMAVEAARTPGPPSWIGTIAGARFGLDSRYVYLAGL